MAGRIPPEFIDQLLGRLDIIDVIDSRVHLKKAGKDFQALCPFHSEKSPSFTVSQDKQFYHCFGCGAHGTAISFLMDYEHMSFPEAVDELARQAGLEVPHHAGHAAADQDDTAPLLQLMTQADAHFRHQLRHHSQAWQAVDYLKGRGLSGEVAAEFGLGYAPPGWRNLTDTLGRDERSLQRLVQAGMVVEQKDQRYDRFRDRIMFPIRDRRGRTIGFGGRVLGNEKPKYLNSPETPLFHKGRELYGLFEARKALRRIDRLMIVEGYMDVIALAQFGIRYAVATLGTATTAEHLERLFRVTRELVFSFDGDRAGRDAAWKALNVALPVAREGREIRFLFLPEGEDPDTLVRKVGADDFAERVRSAEHLSDFFFNRLSAEMDMHSIDGRAHLAEQAKPLLDRLPPGVFREMMVARLAKLTELEPEQLGFKPNRKKPPTLISRTTLRSMPLVRKAIALLLQNPRFALNVSQLSDIWRKLSNPGIEILRQILEIVSENPDIPPAAVVERWRDTEIYGHLNKLIAYKFETPVDGLESEFLDTLRRLNKAYEDQELDRLRKASLTSLSEEEKQVLRKLTDRPATPRNPDIEIEK